MFLEKAATAGSFLTASRCLLPKYSAVYVTKMIPTT